MESSGCSAPQSLLRQPVLSRSRVDRRGQEEEREERQGWGKGGQYLQCEVCTQCAVCSVVQCAA